MFDQRSLSFLTYTPQSLTLLIRGRSTPRRGPMHTLNSAFDSFLFRYQPRASNLFFVFFVSSSLPATFINGARSLSLDPYNFFLSDKLAVTACEYPRSVTTVFYSKNIKEQERERERERGKRTIFSRVRANSIATEHFRIERKNWRIHVKQSSRFVCRTSTITLAKSIERGNIATER